MLDRSNEEMTENQKERRLKQFQSIMASAKAEIARDVSVSIENYGQLEIVRRPVYTETGRLVGTDGSGSPRSDGDTAPLGLEPAGPSSTSESVKPLGGGKLPGDTQGTGQMCSPAENFASVFIQRALRRASEPQRRRLRAFATRSSFPLSRTLLTVFPGYVPRRTGRRLDGSVTAAPILQTIAEPLVSDPRPNFAREC